MSNDININESAILETLNAKIDYDGGNYKGSGLANYVVDKTGDTMTGSLNFNKTGTQIIVQTNEFDQGVAVDSNRYCGIQFNDKNGNRFGKVEGHYMTDGTVKFGINAHRKVNGTPYYAQVLTWVDEKGGVNCSFPMCTSKATTTSSATTSRVAVVVQNYVNGTSWYRVWSDGWVEQGGHYTNTNSGLNNAQSITLLKPFANTDYLLQITYHQTDSEKNVSFRENGFKVKNTDSFTFGIQYTGYSLGIDWYACGY